MEAAKLFTWNLEPAGIWRCSCGDLYRSEEYAEKCCRCRYCGKPARDEWGRGLSCEHRDCRKEADRVRDLQRIEKAEAVENYDGPVFVEWLGYNDGYFACIDDLRDYLGEVDDYEADLDAEERTPRPQWAYCCTTDSVEIDADRAIENAIEEHHEDAGDNIPRDAERKFREAVSEFNKAIAASGFRTWNVDYRRKVAIPASDFAKEPAP